MTMMADFVNTDSSLLASGDTSQQVKMLCSIPTSPIGSPSMRMPASYKKNHIKQSRTQANHTKKNSTSPTTEDDETAAVIALNNLSQTPNKIRCLTSAYKTSARSLSLYAASISPTPNQDQRPPLSSRAPALASGFTPVLSYTNGMPSPHPRSTGHVGRSIAHEESDLFPEERLPRSNIPDLLLNFHDVGDDPSAGRGWSGLRLWCICEFFYSNVDACWYDKNDFMCCLHALDMSHMRVGTRKQWNEVRRMMGKVSRFSPRFLQKESAELELHRQKQRQNALHARNTSELLNNGARLPPSTTSAPIYAHPTSSCLSQSTPGTKPAFHPTPESTNASRCFNKDSSDEKDRCLVLLDKDFLKVSVGIVQKYHSSHATYTVQLEDQQIVSIPDTQFMSYTLLAGRAKSHDSWPLPVELLSPTNANAFNYPFFPTFQKNDLFNASLLSGTSVDRPVLSADRLDAPALNYCQMVLSRTSQPSPTARHLSAQKACTNGATPYDIQRIANVINLLDLKEVILTKLGAFNDLAEQRSQEAARPSKSNSTAPGQHVRSKLLTESQQRAYAHCIVKLEEISSILSAELGRL